MLESIQAMSLLTIMEIVGPVLLLAVLIYGTLQWSRRRRGPTQAVREASTRKLYREGARAEKREEAGKALALERAAVRSGHPLRSVSGGPTDRTMELDAMDRISRVEGGRCVGALMSSGSKKGVRGVCSGLREVGGTGRHA